MKQITRLFTLIQTENNKKISHYVDSILSLIPSKDHCSMKLHAQGDQIQHLFKSPQNRPLNEVFKNSFLQIKSCFTIIKTRATLNKGSVGEIG